MRHVSLLMAIGMLEREGDIVLKVVPDQTRGSLVPPIEENIKSGTEVHTEEHRAYQKRPAGC